MTLLRHEAVKLIHDTGFPIVARKLGAGELLPSEATLRMRQIATGCRADRRREITAVAAAIDHATGADEVVHLTAQGPFFDKGSAPEGAVILASDRNGAPLLNFDQVRELLLSERTARNEAVEDRNRAVTEAGQYRNAMYETLAKRAGDAERAVDALANVDRMHRDLKARQQIERELDKRLSQYEAILSSPWRMLWTMLARHVAAPARKRYAKWNWQRRYTS